MSADVRGARRIWLVVYRALSDAAAKAVMFAITVAAARRLPRDLFALFAVGTTLGWMAAVAADAGLQAHVARVIARRPADAYAVARRWLPVRGALSLVSIVGALALVPLLGVDRNAVPVLAMLILAYAAAGMCEWVYHVWRGLGRSDVESSLTLLHRLVLGLAAALALTLRPTLVPLALALLLAAIVGLLAAGGSLIRLRSLSTDGGNPREGPRIAEFASEVLPIGVGVFVSALYFRVDVLLLERWSTGADVAQYSAVFRVVEALRLLPAAALAVALPALCRATHLGTVARLAAWLAAGAVVASALIWPFAGAGVEMVYGSGFADAASPLRILLLAWPLMALNYALTTQMIAWDRHRAYLVVAVAALCCNIALNWRWIPSAGMVGAAWSTVATECVLTVGCSLVLRRLSSGQLALFAEATAELR